ncbi:MAG TPA: hydrogenase maturation nickel metallochaperone HypA [Solirubrobacter sp.]|nr:hydrogenase maturation nickel metallochaperone HypA [Solirubrobacter sp.]
MHELSIAGAIVEIAAAHAAGRRVHSVHVRVGHLRQVVPSALEFAFELVADGTAVDGARLELEPVPAAGACRACGAESEQDGFPLACKRCGGLDIDVIRGEELQVDSLEVDDEMAVSA